ncbi:MAG: leucine-rich repeat protein [Eubacteriales bacterium]
MKRAIILLAMLSIMIPTAFASDYTFTNGTITDYKGDGGRITLPNVIGETPVTEIGSWAFAKSDSILSVTIPDGVVTVGSFAFRECKSLVTVTLPSTLTSIGNWAFKDCTSLTSITVPEGVTSIGDDAFSGCTSLKTVTLPSTLKSLGEDAFSGCRALTTLTLPETLKTMGENAFAGCSSLKSITVPTGLITIEDNAFDGCTSLTTINIPNTVKTIRHYAFKDCTSLTEVNFDGTRSEWNSITTYSFGNTTLIGATINCTDDVEEEVVSLPKHSDWATGNLLTAMEYGLLVDSLGSDYTVAIKRSQIAQLLVHMVETYTGSALEAADSATFTDTSDTSILKAYAAGIISGSGEGTFTPDGEATREQIALMTYKAILHLEGATGKTLVSKNTSISGFSDGATVSTWARGAVGILTNNGLMSGTSGSTLSPLSTTSIEVAVVLNNGVYKLG